MKRKVIMLFLIILCFLLQATLFEKLAFAYIRPNLLLIVTASVGFMRGKKRGMEAGFFSGLLMDVFWGNLIGFYALLYTLIGYFNGSFKRLFYDDDIKLPLGLVGISDLAYGIVLYVCYYLLRGDFTFSYYLFSIILPELVYTILATLVLYQIILHINRRLETEEQRSASRFV